MAATETRETQDISCNAEEQVIVDRIFSAVMEQRLAPRTKLNEAALCETFGVGRMRVRRALLLLGSQGIVELRSNRGAYVACPSAEEAAEVFEARMMIEPELVKAMATRVSPEVVAELRHHLEKEDAARRKRERSELIRLSGEFHVKLAEGHGNAVLARVIKELVTRTSLIVGLFGLNRASTCPEDEHSRIVDAIASGDGKAAGRIVREHLTHIQQGLELTREDSATPDLVKILKAG